MTREQQAVISKVTKKYGSTINLEAHPEVLFEILRAFGRLFDDLDGGLPGGVPPSPPPPPPPCIVEGGRVTQEDLMNAILRLTRDVAAIKSSIDSRN
jgi:hypothetical protein